MMQGGTCRRLSIIGRATRSVKGQDSKPGTKGKFTAPPCTMKGDFFEQVAKRNVTDAEEEQK